MGRKKVIGSKGTTLIEVLAALALVSLMAVGVSAALVNASGWNRMAADETRATAYAVEIMELIKASRRNLSDLSPGTYSDGLGNWNYLGLATAGARQGMEARVSVTDYELDSGLYRVDVEVSWETVGKIHHVGLSSVIWALEVVE